MMCSDWPYLKFSLFFMDLLPTHSKNIKCCWVAQTQVNSQNKPGSVRIPAKQTTSPNVMVGWRASHKAVGRAQRTPGLAEPQTCTTRGLPPPYPNLKRTGATHHGCSHWGQRGPTAHKCQPLISLWCLLPAKPKWKLEARKPRDAVHREEALLSQAGQRSEENRSSTTNGAHPACSPRWTPHTKYI